MKRGSGIKPPAVQPKRCHSNLTKPTAASLARSRLATSAPVTRSQTKGAVSQQKPNSTFGTGFRFGNATNHTNDTKENGKTQTAKPLKKSNPAPLPRLSTATTSKQQPKVAQSSITRHESITFKPMASLDLNMLCQNNNTTLNRMTLMATDLMDPIQRKAFIELKRHDEKVRFSLDYGNPNRERVSLAMQLVHESRVKDSNPVTTPMKAVTFVEQPDVYRISADNSTPTSTFLHRVKNTPKLMQNTQPIRSQLHTPISLKTTLDSRLSEKDEAEEFSPPEPTPTHKSASCVQMGVDENVDAVSVTLNDLKSFVVRFRTLTFDQIKLLKEKLSSDKDSNTLDTLTGCVKMLQD